MASDESINRKESAQGAERVAETEKEAGRIGGTAAVQLEAEARQAIIDALKEPAKDEFSSFRPEDYLSLFYPDLAPEVADKLKQVVDMVTHEDEGVQTIDLREFAKALAPFLPPGAESAMESLENYLIYDFMIRRAVPRILEAIPEDHLRVLDVGGGPSIYQHIPFMGIADSITHSEYLAANREVVERWSAGEEPHDWSTYIRFFKTYLQQNMPAMRGTPEVNARLESLGQADESSIESAMRSLIKQVVPVDVFKPGLGLEQQADPDVVQVSRQGGIELMTSNFCIESATADRETWRRGMANVAEQVPPGRFLLMTAIRNATWYKVGEEKMPAVAVDGDSLSLELMTQGFEILELSELTGSDRENVGYDGMVFVLARKKE